MKIRLLVSSLVVLFVAVGALAQTYTFTNAGATGRFGPTQAQCNTAYGVGVVTVTTQGIQEWVVPSSGNYSIEMAGASGGSTVYSSGGQGRRLRTEVFLVAGTTLKIVVGQQGLWNGNSSQFYSAGSGGGGSFVYTGAIGGAGLIAAAAGGGGGLSSNMNNFATNEPNGNYSNNGSTITIQLGYTANGGVGGNGGGFSSRGFLMGGPGSGWFSEGNMTYANGGNIMSGTRFDGGQGLGSYGVAGGFGGGGAAGDIPTYNYGFSGGGGGYSGGGSGGNGGNSDGQYGGGGGSFMTGVNQQDLGLNNGHGFVVITSLCIPTVGSLVVDNPILPTINAECSANVPIPTATNSCGTINGVPNVTFPITNQGLTVVTWTYSDGTNTTTQTQNVNVNDVTAPVISCPTTITVNNVPSTCGATVNFTNPTATDNCSTAPVIPGYTVYGTFGGSTYYRSNVMLLASDQNTQQTLAAGFATNTLSINSPAENTYVLGIRNSIGELVIPFNDATNEGFFVWTNGSPITYTNWNFGEPNNAGNEDFVQMIPGSGLWNDLGNFSGYYILEWVNGSVVTTQTAGLTSGSTFPVGTTINTFQATDANGNTASCSFSVVVIDNEPPVANCANPIVQLDVTGNVMLNTNDVNAGSSDNCAVTSLTLSQTDFDCSHIGANTVTLTATDAAGNSNSCNATVTVQDLIAPTVTCADITVNNVPDNCGRVVNYAVPVATDNCNVTVTQTDASGLSAGDLFPVGSTPQQYTYTDQGGNSVACSFNVIVNDVQAPEITPFPFSNITVNNTTGLCGANVPWIEPTASDNCPGVILTASHTMGSFFPVGTTTVTYTASDAVLPVPNTASLSFTVTVVDNEAPVITNCPSSIAINTDATFCYATVGSLGSPTFTDNCAVTSTTNDAPATFPVGTTPVTWTVQDAAGNTTSCTQNVIVTDNQFPVASCIDISVDLDASGNATITGASVDGGSSDECGLQPLVVSQTVFNCSNEGANSVTLTVEDVNGNVSTCTAVVTINDVTAPNAVCQAVTVNLDAAGNGSTSEIDVNNGSSDACGIASMTLSQTAFTCADITTNPNAVTLTVEDVNGNISTCSANVTVVDAVSPIALCQIPTIFLDASGNATISVLDIDNGSSDACGIASSSIDVTSFTCANVGTNTVTLTITDNNSNTSTCTSTVTVVDDVDPIALCQDVTVNLDATGNGSTTAAAVDNGSNDACGIASIVLSQTTFTCAEVGTKVVTLTVTDVNGNSSTCPSTVTIEDNIAPTATCQSITVQLDANGNGSITGSQVNDGSSDACGIASYALDITDFTCADVTGPNPVVLTVTDVNGNASTCNANVTVEDNVDPIAACQDITIFLDGTGNVSIVAADVDDVSSDACGIASISATPLAFNCTNIGANNVVLTVNDNNGNSANCTAVVTVLETTAPIAVCQNIPVSLNTAGTATILATDLNNGSSDNCSIVSYTATQTTFDCSDLGANSVDLTVTDGSGNSATCNATVTVSDAIAPTAICQDITVNLNAAGSATITASSINDGSFDNCTITSSIASQTTFSCANVGDNNVTLTLTDQSGNSSLCVAVVTVEDNINPTAICINYTANLDATGNVTITASNIDNGSFDNCGILSTVLSNTAYTCANVGLNLVTLTVTDVNSNVSTCTATVNVVDDLDPIMVCQNISVNLNAAGNATITAAMINNGSSDNCGIVSLSASQTSFNCSNVGTNNIILTAIDVNGNTNTCPSVVTIVDAVAPNAVCQNISVNLNASGNATITGAMINNGSSDACGIASLVASPSAFTCANVGPNTVTLTVNDVNGNNATCTSTVTVVDNIAPTALCQNYTANLDAAGTVTVTSANIDNASFDNCGIATLVVSPATFGCSNVGANSVTMTVTDVNGLVSICSATVTVVDNIAPNAVCQNISVNLNAAGNATINGAMVNNGSTDNCSIASLTVSPSSFTCANVGTNPVTLTVTDVNSNSSTCTATVTVVDNIAPTAICQNISVNLNAAGNASITAAGINNGSFDNCGIATVVASPTAFTCANVGPNTVTLTVTDVNTNVSTCTSTVTVVDNLAPNALCQNITANLDATGAAVITAAMINNGSNDNCGIASTVASTTNFSCANVGANNVTLTVTDVNGNSAACNSIVNVVDAVAPTAICQNTTINLNAAGSATITASMINNGSNDACGVATLTASQTVFTCANVGPNTVTLTVMDVNTNTSTCTATVTVVDNIAPIALCQNVTVNLDATGNASVTAAQVNNGSTDACGIATTVVTPNAFTCANVGPNTVTLTVTDVNGNASTCTSTVNVIDNIAPTALCQAITVNLDATGNASITAASINSGSFDNCAIASTVASTTNFDCTDVGNNTVTLTLTDVNGNVAACNAVVTIVDVTVPIALCQDQTLTIDIFGNASTTVAALNNGSSDECGIASITASQTIFDCTDLGANNITLTVTDVNGNVSNCTSVVTLQDLIAPTIVTQDITVALDATGSVTITGAMITAAAFDNCAITSIVLPTSTFDCTDIGPNNVTLIVSDASGNSATGTAVVTVVDNMAPNALCQNVSVNLSAAGTASITPAMINNGSTDNCGIASVTASPLNFTCSNVGNNNVTLTVNDVNGNSATCLAVVTVIDNIAPIAVCQNVTLNLDSNGDALLTPAMVNNGSSDNCSIAFMGVSQANFTCANTGANTITFTATDASGNSSTCTSTVTIVDNTAPNAICENITINLDATGSATITAAMIDNASNDNCSVATLTASQTTFDCSNVGDNNITLTVTDPSGNSATCTAVVTVVDNVAPAAICQDATVNLDATGNGSITAAAINNGSSDACGIASTVASATNFTCANVGPNTVTLTVTDVNGNSSTCTSTVTVVDAIAPNALCQNVSVSLNPAGNAAITVGMINNGSSDACGIATITASQTAFDCTDLGANNVTLTVTDVNGNVGTCVVVVTVIDGIAPVITCAPNVTVNNNPGICGATVTLVSPIATDNCTVTITNNAPALYNLGTTTVLWTATDAAGKAVTCAQTVTVLDNQAPSITCPANLTVNTDPNICFATGVNLGTPVTADNCTVASVTNNAPSVYPVGTTTVTWTVVDQAGNATTCTQTVTVIDNQAPVVVCTSDIVLNTVEGSCGRVVTYAMPTVVDNCSVISMTQSDASGYTSGDIFPVGTTVISYTAVDGSGNTYTCSFNVTIVDNQNPVLVGCPSNMTVESGAGSCDVAVNWVSPTANDNCPGVDLTTTHTPGSLFGPGSTVVSYQAIDNSGNLTSCSFTVTVVDGNSPIVPELADVYNSCQVNTLPSPVADDICAGEITGTTTTIFPITTVGVTPVIWTFNDGNGNISTATQYVYIDGEVDATVTIVDDVTLMANNTNATYQWIDCATGNAIPGATNQTFVATANGEYAVIVTEGNCPAETSDCITVKNVGLEDVSFEDLTIYPNPSVGGLFTINFSGKIDKVEIVDMIGRVIAVEVNLENGSVNGTELASGKYFVRVYSEGTSIAKEVIVINK